MTTPRFSEEFPIISLHPVIMDPSDQILSLQGCLVLLNSQEYRIPGVALEREPPRADQPPTPNPARVSTTDSLDYPGQVIKHPTDCSILLIKG